jgi:hypothetical protein
MDADIARGGPNAMLTLSEARANYALYGACAEDMRAHVRAPRPEEMGR